ncbi:MAG: hypothetical protein HYR90_02880 [Candidatus Andersenbacteria bacterium]|nr:hypothetical protein [Candidatus Andersenbacteria bacterium]MBI3251102.1 hypothetical protein [Candidatus Andersenbacteria bacterium]
MSSAAIEKVLGALENVRQSGSNWTARCPAHDDQHNSLSISEGNDGRALLKCHVGCDVKDIVAALGFKMRDLFIKKERDGSSSQKSATTQPEGCTVDQYAEAKQLKKYLLGPLGVTDQVLHGTPAVRIAYYGPDRSEVGVRYRTALHKTDQEDNRFRWKSGSKPTLYGLWRIGNGKQDGYILFLEGESDVHTAWEHGLPAVGIPGAAIWKEDWAQYFSDIPAIYVVIEPDKGGEAMLKWLAKSAIRHKVRLVRLEGAKDVSELHCQDPDQFTTKLRQALDTAITWDEYNRTDEKKRREQAWTKCQALAQQPNILDLFADALERAGVVGVRKVAKLVYLCVTSRVLSHPVSAAIKALSSAGKSFMVAKVLKFVPPGAYYVLTAMSERALAYDDEPLKHRILVIVEAAGLQGETANLLVRSLLSEGHVRYKTVEKTPQGLRPKLIEREGPTGLIVTTTSLHLHQENETRIFSIPMSDTPEQTRNIMLALANEEKVETDFSSWHALQDWVAYGDRAVTIPFASVLANMIPPVAVRLRRDFNALLNLIRTHALLHQVHRKRDAKGRIVATFDDYAAVRELVADIVSEGLETTVSEATRDTVRAVEKLLQDDPNTQVTFAAIARELGIDKSTAKRRADAAIDAGFLKNEALKGRPANLALGEPLPEDQHILPPEAELRQRCVVATENGSGKSLPAPTPSDNTPGDKKEAIQSSSFPLFGQPHQCEFQEINKITRCVHCGEFPPKAKQGL